MADLTVRTFVYRFCANDVQRHQVADARGTLIVTATTFVTPIVLLLIGRWGDDPDVNFDKIVRMIPFVCATPVQNLIRKVLLCEYC